MDRLYSLLRIVSNWLSYFAIVVVLLILCMNILDIFLSKAFNFPIYGSSEITGYSQAIIICFMMPLTHLMGRHIRVDFLIARFPKRAQSAITGIVFLILAVLFGILIWQLFKFGLNLQDRGQYSVVLKIPIHPFLYVLSVAFVVPCILYLLDSFHSFQEVRK